MNELANVLSECSSRWETFLPLLESLPLSEIPVFTLDLLKLGLIANDLDNPEVARLAIAKPLEALGHLDLSEDAFRQPIGRCLQAFDDEVFFLTAPRLMKVATDPVTQHALATRLLGDPQLRFANVFDVVMHWAPTESLAALKTWETVLSEMPSVPRDLAVRWVQILHAAVDREPSHLKALAVSIEDAVANHFDDATPNEAGAILTAWRTWAQDDTSAALGALTGIVLRANTPAKEAAVLQHLRYELRLDSAAVGEWFDGLRPRTNLPFAGTVVALILETLETLPSSIEQLPVDLMACIVANSSDSTRQRTIPLLQVSGRSGDDFYLGALARHMASAPPSTARGCTGFIAAKESPVDLPLVICDPSRLTQDEAGLLAMWIMVCFG